MEENQPIRDYIFPLIRGSFKNEIIQYDELVGTGFLIGESGFAMTAGHVVDQLFENNNENLIMFGMFVENDKWRVIAIERFEKHHSEDVGILKLKNLKRKSFLRIDNTPQFSSCQYHCWGYPKEVAKELQMIYENAFERPDLIFTQGYIRRRISRDLYPTMLFKGKQFYELSETVGQGNSGGPIISKRNIFSDYWNVIGIYIGEKDRGNLSYAIRAEAFADWIPDVLGTTIMEESNNIITTS